MIKIAVCDDEIQEINKINEIISKYAKEKPQYEFTVVSFSAPMEMILYAENNGAFDIYLLDIYMAGMLGIDAARELRQLDDKGEFIFITSSRDHALSAFEVEAAQYIIKPYTETAIYGVLDKVLKRLNVERRHMITVKSSDGLHRLFTRDIVFSEPGKNNYQIIHTIQGHSIEVRKTATELYNILSFTRNFIRCGVSINLNLRYVRQITKEHITFDTGQQISYPYRSYQKIKEEFLRFQLSEDE